jgi:hypothetical protein
MLKKLVFAALALLLVHGARADGDPVATALLDGRWEGTLTNVSRTTTLPADLRFRIHIAGRKAEVFFAEKAGQWEEWKPGQFAVFQNNFTAVIFASDSAHFDCWDETVSFMVALDSANQLLTQHNRVVSNVRCMSAKAATFGEQSTGTLRAQPVPGAVAVPVQ